MKKNETILAIAILLLLGPIYLAMAVETSEESPKTFAERIDELEAQQRALQQGSASVDSPVTSAEQDRPAASKSSNAEFEAKLNAQVTALEQQIQGLKDRPVIQPNHDAVKARVTRLESQVQAQIKALDQQIQGLRDRPVIQSDKDASQTTW